MSSRNLAWGGERLGERTIEGVEGRVGDLLGRFLIESEGTVSPGLQVLVFDPHASIWREVDVCSSHKFAAILKSGKRGVVLGQNDVDFVVGQDVILPVELFSTDLERLPTESGAKSEIDVLLAILFPFLAHHGWVTPG